MYKPSVLLVVYNENPDWLMKSVESIINQTYEDYEFIIINDGSDKKETIKTLQIIGDMDHRINVFNKKSIIYAKIHLELFLWEIKIL